ncbi:MAG: replication protein [Candidatus Competibacteraceae bacterium]|nr:MAG: replication protein [Candidatus Competibacteraceae bacterium]
MPNRRSRSVVRTQRSSPRSPRPHAGQHRPQMPSRPRPRPAGRGRTPGNGFPRFCY